VERYSNIMFGAIVVMAFAVGILWQRVNSLQSSGVARGSTTQGVQGTTTAGSPDGAVPVNGKLSASQAQRLKAVSDEDFIRGNRDAQVFVVEYSDLECPFCQRFHGTAQQAVDDYGGDVAWVYRHFPLDSIHPSAKPAAIASECVNQIAGEEVFWRFTDAIFASQQSALSDLGGTAEALGVSRGQFEACVKDGSLEANVDSDYQSGLTAGVTGTPGNFVANSSGEVWAIPGAVPYAQLEAVINEALGS